MSFTSWLRHLAVSSSAPVKQNRLTGRLLAGIGVACLGLLAVAPMSAQKLNPRATFRGQGKTPSAVVFSGGGATLAWGSQDGTIRLGDVTRGKVTATFKGQ